MDNKSIGKVNAVESPLEQRPEQSPTKDGELSKEHSGDIPMPDRISRDVSNEIGQDSEGRGSEDTNSVSSAQRSVRSDATSGSRKKGKIGDALADWDPFFEAED